ncbi:DNA-binding protein inhibitor ID-2 [Nematostella vectensis]|uniref:DNA-binding protein inhibitor ID-2 n=1 Tax=Nematostella vectensis TaxID=45351 RepID=UPI0013906DA9|nr:DNA-binding protein inhibitor ID-2 [Nematostella vectensis]
MKPQSKPTDSKFEEALRATIRSASSITRASIFSEFERDSNDNMSECYERLKNMVPNVPVGRRISKVEILQYVIDYILDLQTALENQTANRRRRRSNRVNRSPLSTISLNEDIEKA